MAKLSGEPQWIKLSFYFSIFLLTSDAIHIQFVDTLLGICADQVMSREGCVYFFSCDEYQPWPCCCDFTFMNNHVQLSCSQMSLHFI